MFGRVYSFSLSHSSEQVSSVWSRALQCHLLHAPFAYRSLTKSSWTGLAIRPPWMRSRQRWDIYKHTISSRQIIESKALWDHSLSPSNSVHIYIVKKCEGVPKAFYCVRYYDYMDRLFMQQLRNSIKYNSSSTANKSSARQEISHVFWNPKVFTRTHHFSLSSSSQSSPFPPALYVLILFCHLQLHFTSGLLYSGFVTKILYDFLIFPHASFTEYPIPF